MGDLHKFSVPHPTHRIWLGIVAATCAANEEYSQISALSRIRAVSSCIVFSLHKFTKNGTDEFTIGLGELS